MKLQRRIEADIDLEIDGQPAKFTGSGRHLRLEVNKASTLHKLTRVALPDLGRAGSPLSMNEMPTLLSAEGLTLEVADRYGPLLILGDEARGKGYNVPGSGRVRDVKLAKKRAAVRLASSTNRGWLGIGLLFFGGVIMALLVLRRNDEI